MKLLNEVSLSSIKKIPIQASASWLWRELTNSSTVFSDTKELLVQFRKFDRANAKWIEGPHPCLAGRQARPFSTGEGRSFK
jgi:hypothetical protein